MRDAGSIPADGIETGCFSEILRKHSGSTNVVLVSCSNRAVRVQLPSALTRPLQALSKDSTWGGRSALSGELRGTVRAVRVRIPLAFLGPRQALSKDRAWHGSNYDIVVTCSIRFEQCGFESHCRTYHFTHVRAFVRRHVRTPCDTCVFVFARRHSRRI